MPEDYPVERNWHQPSNRLPAVDAMRGLVMVLMTVDHASHAFNAGRYVADSIAWYQPGSAIPAAQFLVRWMTHICAPSFIFLAGLSLSFSIARKQARGVADRRVDADMLLRGLFIMALDPLWMSLGFGGRTVLQVLYAIGGSLCCMVLLRRCKTGVLLAAGLVLMLTTEALAGLVVWLGGETSPGPVGALLFTGGRLGDFGYVLYPLMPWLAYMILGWVCGRRLQAGGIRRPAQWFAAAGATAMALFLVVRGLNGYGNMLLYRDDLSVLQWLHVSKYPPSLAFACLTLGLMGLFQALFFRIYADGRARPADPLLVFGRTPLFFYGLHVHLLSGGARLMGMWKSGGLGTTFAAAIAILLLLYPLCRWYAGIKTAHPNSMLRYL